MTSHKFMFLLLLLLLASSPQPSEAQCLPRQREALLRLRSGFNDSKNNLSSWTASTDCCRGWVGVTCDGSSGEVTALNLSGFSLSGKVDPDGLSNLTALTSLNLAFNSLDFGGVSSSIPVFQALGRLTHLNLSYSGIKGQIPSLISTLTSLVSLDLSNLFLGVSLQNPNLGMLVSNLERLEELYLDGVDISSDGSGWSTALSESLPRLRMLSFVRCNLTGPIDASIAGLRFLSSLRLDGNSLNSTVPGFLGNLSSLQVLGLSSCGLRGSLPDELFRLWNLRILDLSSNPQLTGPLPESIGSLASLERLMLANCMISGSIPALIGNLERLSKFDLSKNNLTGGLPSFQSTNISEIVLGNNFLNGSIPPLYGKSLLKLAVLDLQNNSLTGTLPLSLFHLPSLKTLDLHQNMLSSSLGGLSDASAPLETLDLSSNNLQGPFPTAIFNLSSLKFIDFSYNNFSGTVALKKLQNLRNLSSLDLSYNNLTVVDAESYSSLPNVSTLKLASCSIAKVPAFLRNQTKIVYLDLSANRITGPIPAWLWSMGSNSSFLNHLNLSHNLLTGFEAPLPDPFNSSIKVLDLHSNRLTGPILFLPASNSVADYSNNNFSTIIPSNIFLYLKFTIFFSISNNSLGGSLPQSICQAPFLQVLDLSLNKLSGPIPPCLANASSLRVLNLRDNSFNGSIMSNFTTNCSLRTFNLNNNELQGSIPELLSNCRMLEVLDLGNNRLNGIFPGWLCNLTQLQVLVLRSNRFTGSVNGVKGTFPKLQIIDLSSNHFVGSFSPSNLLNLTGMKQIASQPVVQFRYLQGLYYQDTVMITSKGQEMTLVKILTIYTSIDVSNNRFEGSIPDRLGTLKALAILNMSHNFLSGPIPESLGNLNRLESLDLSYNNLSGLIPSTLANLSFLSSLDLSYNNLSGRIPNGRQFSTFSNASFLGNRGLCGPPLSVNCTSPQETAYHHKCRAIKLNWLFISVGFGFGGGFALSIGPLLLFRNWRELFNNNVDKLLLVVFPRSFWEWVSCGIGRVDAEEKVEESDWVDAGPEHPFCIFCTGLDFSSGQAIIHHRQCSCTRNHQ